MAEQKKRTNAKGQELVVLEDVHTGTTTETGDLKSINSLLANGHRVKRASAAIRQELADAGAPVDRAKQSGSTGGSK